MTQNMPKKYQGCPLQNKRSSLLEILVLLSFSSAKIWIVLWW